MMILDATARPTHDWGVRPSGLIVPGDYVHSRPVAIDFFAGAGGMSLGFHQAGWHVIAAVELDFSAAITYMVNLARPGVRIHFDTEEREAEFEAHLERMMRPRKGETLSCLPHVAGSGWIRNHPNEPGCEHFWIADIRNLTGEEMLRTMGRARGEIDAVMGGPPCQGFSTAGRREVMDPRNSLVFEFGRIVIEIHPKTMVMENVPGILGMVTPEGPPVVDTLCRMLEDGNFGTYNALRKALLSANDARALSSTTVNEPEKAKKSRVKKAQVEMSLFDHIPMAD